MNFFTITLIYIEKIPATFWGVLIGAAFALSGVVISNRANTKNLETQMANDRLMKKLDREYAARKEIFLEAAEAISIAMRSLANFAVLELSPPDLMKDFTSKAAVLSKVFVIGSPKTMRALSAVNLSLSEAVVDLTEKRTPLINEQAVLFIEEKIYKEALLDFERVIELQKQFNIQGTRDDAEWIRLCRLSEMNMDRANENRNIWAIHATELRRRSLILYQESLKHHEKVSSLVPSLLEAVRNELELPFDAAVFKEISEASSAALQKSGQRFLDVATKETEKYKATQFEPLLKKENGKLE
jgi:hypothetical protein